MHELVGQGVTYYRPVVTKPSVTKQDDKGNAVVTVAEFELQETDGIIIGVATQPAPEDGSPTPPPKLQIAFAHADRLLHLGGSGWREAFDRAVDVLPATDPLVKTEDAVGYYVNDDTDDYADAYRVWKAAQSKPAVSAPAVAAPNPTTAGADESSTGQPAVPASNQAPVSAGGDGGSTDPTAPKKPAAFL